MASNITSAPSVGSSSSASNDMVQFNGQSPERGSVSTVAESLLGCKDIMRLVFRDLSLHDLKSSALVCRGWYAIVKSNNSDLVDAAAMSQFARSAADWAVFAAVPELDVPRGIARILGGDCPIWEGKRVFETHMLYLMPDTLEGKKADLGEFVMLADRKHGPGKWPPEVTGQLSTQPIRGSCWILVTLDYVPKSHHTSIEAKRELVEALGSRYRFLRVVELVAAHILFDGPDQSLPWSTCEEVFDRGWSLEPLIMGVRFDTGGLGVAPTWDGSVTGSGFLVGRKVDSQEASQWMLQI